jgi:hypothetical protein
MITRLEKEVINGENQIRADAKKKPGQVKEEESLRDRGFGHPFMMGAARVVYRIEGKMQVAEFVALSGPHPPEIAALKGTQIKVANAHFLQKTERRQENSHKRLLSLSGTDIYGTSRKLGREISYNPLVGGSKHEADVQFDDDEKPCAAIKLLLAIGEHSKSLNIRKVAEIQSVELGERAYHTHMNSATMRDWSDGEFVVSCPDCERRIPQLLCECGSQLAM